MPIESKHTHYCECFLCSRRIGFLWFLSVITCEWCGTMVLLDPEKRRMYRLPAEDEDAE